MFFKKKTPSYPFKEYPIMQQPSLMPNAGQQAQIDRKFGMFMHFGINTFENLMKIAKLLRIRRKAEE